MKLFVTGGTGFFGKALLRFWEENPPNFDRIFILSRNPQKFKDKYSHLIHLNNISLVSGDIMDPDSFEVDSDIDIVLHAATDSTLGPMMSRLEVFNQILKGTENVLEFCVKKSIKKLVYTSTGGVYGAQLESKKIIEDFNSCPDPIDPKSSHNIAKKACENLIAIYSEMYKFDYTIARCFSFIGEDLPLENHFAIGNFISAVLNNKDIIIRGDGTPFRSYMHQNDLAYVLNKFLTSKTNHKVFNVGSDEAISIKDLAHLIKKIGTYTGDINILFENDHNVKNYYVPNTDRLKAFIGDYQLMNLERSINISLRNIQNKDSV